MALFLIHNLAAGGQPVRRWRRDACGRLAAEWRVAQPEAANDPRPAARRLGIAA